MVMDNIFDRWNEVKKHVNALSPSEPFPMVREVWVGVIGKNIGYEQNGGIDNFLRPVLIVKKFNNHMFLVVPLSTKQKIFDFYYNFTDPNNIPASVILAQIRLISVKRLKRRLYDLSIPDFKLVKYHLRSFFS